MLLLCCGGRTISVNKDAGRTLLRTLSTTRKTCVSNRRLTRTLNIDHTTIRGTTRTLLTRKCTLSSTPHQNCQLTNNSPFYTSTINPCPTPVRLCSALRDSGLATGRLTLNNTPRNALILATRRGTKHKQLKQQFRDPTKGKICLSLVLQPTLSTTSTRDTAVDTTITITQTIETLYKLRLNVG